MARSTGLAVERRTFIVFGVGALLLLAASTGQSGWLFVIAGGVLGLVGSAPFLTRAIPEAALVRSVSHQARVGDRVPVSMAVTAPADRAIPLARLEDQSLGLEPAAYLIPGLAAGDTAVVTTERLASRRGEFPAGAARLVSGAPLGFLRRTRDTPIAGSLVVLPKTFPLRAVGFLDQEHSIDPAPLARPERTGAGVDLHAVREHRPGDPHRLIHWRSTARTDRLIVREMEEEARPLLVLGVDTASEASDPFEALIEVVGSVGIYALRTGWHVQVVGRGTRSLDDPTEGELLRWLAALARDEAGADAVVPPVASDAVATLFAVSGSLGYWGDRFLAAARQRQTRAVAVIARTDTWGSDKLKDGGPEGPVIRPGADRTFAFGRDEDVARCLR
jgi:uncharacterized protein (DUF58 family)